MYLLFQILKNKVFNLQTDKQIEHFGSTAKIMKH